MYFSFSFKNNFILAFEITCGKIALRFVMCRKSECDGLPSKASKVILQNDLHDDGDDVESACAICLRRLELGSNAARRLVQCSKCQNVFHRRSRVAHKLVGIGAWRGLRKEGGGWRVEGGGWRVEGGGLRVGDGSGLARETAASFGTRKPALSITTVAPS